MYLRDILETEIPETITIVKGNDGSDMWFSAGLIHRDNAPAIRIPGNRAGRATELYFKRGILHRVGGPAWCLENGDKRWYVNGLLHREDGPAIQTKDGIDHFYLRGKKMSRKEYIKWFEDTFCKNV